MKKNYYEILEVSPNASMEIIKAAYRSLAKRYHTDNGSEDTEKMAEINEAYAVLSDETKRAEYDAQFESNTFTNTTKTYASGEELFVDVFGKKVTFAKQELTGMMVHNMFTETAIEPIMTRFMEKLEIGSVLKISEGRVVAEPLTNLQDFCLTIRNELSECMVKILAHFGIYTYSVDTVKNRYDWSELFELYGSSLKDMKEYLIESYHSQGATTTDRDLDEEYSEMKWRQQNSLVANLTYDIANEIKDSFFGDVDDYQSEVDESRHCMKEEFINEVKQIVTQSAWMIERVLFACLKDENIELDDDISTFIVRDDACRNVLSNNVDDGRISKEMLIKAFDFNPFCRQVYTLLLQNYFEESDSVIKFFKENKYEQLYKYDLFKVLYTPSDEYEKVWKYRYRLTKGVSDDGDVEKAWKKYIRPLRMCTLEGAIESIIYEKITIITKLESEKVLHKDVTIKAIENLENYCERFDCSLETFKTEEKLLCIYLARDNWIMRDELMTEVEKVKTRETAEVIKFLDGIKDDERYKFKPYIYKDADAELNKYLFETIKKEVEDIAYRSIAEIEDYIVKAKADYGLRFLEEYEMELKSTIEEKADKELEELYSKLNRTNIDAMNIFIDKVEKDYGKYGCAKKYIQIVSKDIEDEQECLMIAELGSEFGENMDSKVATSLISKVKDTSYSEVVKKRVYQKIKKQLFKNNLPCINKIMNELAIQFPAVKDSKSGLCVYVEQADYIEGMKKSEVMRAEIELDNLGGVEQPILSNLKTGLLDFSGRESGFSITQKSLLYYEKGIINRILLKDIVSFSLQKKLLLVDLVVTISNGMSVKLPNKFPKEIINFVPNILTEAVRLVKESEIYDE